MTENDLLAARFEENRGRLRDVAYRMLGSASEADDAVQEAWLRLSRSGAGQIGNLAGWLTTVVARVCLDMLRTRRSRREDDEYEVPLEEPAPVAEGPDRDLLLADAVGLALLTVLDSLSPTERVAFVLHDMFDLPFDEIANIAGVSPVAARQLASRARRRVKGADAEGDRAKQRELVDAFFAASREGDLTKLLSLLAPEVVLRADPMAVAGAAKAGPGAPKLAPEIHGAESVAKTLVGRARGAQPAMVAGAPGAAWVVGGQPRAAFAFTIEGDRITGIDVVADPATIRDLEITVS
jgi:RNA polymerase sigma-70 factor (ECF subfamily)